MVNPGRSEATIKSAGKLIEEPADDVKVTAGLVCVPKVLDVVATVIEHDPNAPNCASINMMEVPPSEATIDPWLKSQSVKTTAGSLTVTPAGNVSLKLNAVTGEADPLLMVKVAVVCDPGPMVSGANTLVNDGWA